MRLKVQLVSERATCLSRMYTSKSDSCGMLGNSVPDRRLLRQSWPDLDRPPACLTPHARNSATSVSTATAEKCQTCHRVLAICYLLLSTPIPVHTTTIVLCINADLVIHRDAILGRACTARTARTACTACTTVVDLPI